MAKIEDDIKKRTASNFNQMQIGHLNAIQGARQEIAEEKMAKLKTDTVLLVMTIASAALAIAAAVTPLTPLVITAVALSALTLFAGFMTMGMRHAEKSQHKINFTNNKGTQRSFDISTSKKHAGNIQEIINNLNYLKEENNSNDSSALPPPYSC